MEKTKLPLKSGIQFFILGTTALLQACTTSPRLASGGLEFTNGMTDEPQLSRAIARFCDSAYIAVNQSQEITTYDVLNRFEKIRSMREKWSSPIAIAELTKASLISNKKTDIVYERFVELEKKLSDDYDMVTIAELAKASIVTETEASDVVSMLRSYDDSSRKWELKTSAVELTKLSLFAMRNPVQVMATYDEFATRQGRIGGEKELVELTKSAILTGRTPNDLVKIFDQIEKMDRGMVSRSGAAELVKLSILTNSSPKTVYYRYADIASRSQRSLNYAGGRTLASVKKEHDRSLELLKLSLLGKRTPDEVVKLYDRFHGLEDVSSNREQSKMIVMSLITGELLQDSVFGNHVDECNGGYARLILSIDSYRYEEG